MDVDQDNKAIPMMVPQQKKPKIVKIKTYDKSKKKYRDPERADYFNQVQKQQNQSYFNISGTGGNNKQLASQYKKNNLGPTHSEYSESADDFQIEDL